MLIWWLWSLLFLSCYFMPFRTLCNCFCCVLSIKQEIRIELSILHLECLKSHVLATVNGKAFQSASFKDDQLVWNKEVAGLIQWNKCGWGDTRFKARCFQVSHSEAQLVRMTEFFSFASFYIRFLKAQFVILWTRENLHCKVKSWSQTNYHLLFFH